MAICRAILNSLGAGGGGKSLSLQRPCDLLLGTEDGAQDNTPPFSAPPSSQPVTALGLGHLFLEQWLPPGGQRLQAFSCADKAGWGEGTTWWGSEGSLVEAGRGEGLCAAQQDVWAPQVPGELMREAPAKLTRGGESYIRRRWGGRVPYLGIRMGPSQLCRKCFTFVVCCSYFLLYLYYKKTSNFYKNKQSTIMALCMLIVQAQQWTQGQCNVIYCCLRFTP